MSRQNPLRFAFSLALEVALVVGIVSVLPRVDLGGHRTEATEPASTNAADKTFALTQRDAEGQSFASRSFQSADAVPRPAPITALPAKPLAGAWTLVRDALNPEALDPDKTTSDRTPFEASRINVPPRLLDVEAERHSASLPAGPQLAPPTGTDSAAPESARAESHYAEQWLDRASQTLLNGLGSYVARAAGEFLKGPDAQANVQPAASYERRALQAPPAQTLSSPAANESRYIVRSQSAPTSQPIVTLPPTPAVPSYSVPSYTVPTRPAPLNSTPARRELYDASTPAPQITLPAPTGTASNSQDTWNSFPTEPALPAAPQRPSGSFRQWRNY